MIVAEHENPRSLTDVLSEASSSCARADPNVPDIDAPVRVASGSDDVKEIVKDVLRHRIILTYEAEIDNITSENVIEEILNLIESP